MKKIICLLLALIMCLGLCACATQTQNEQGTNVDGLGPYVYIRDTNGDFNDSMTYSHWLGYHRNTKIVYECFALGSNGGYISPYQIYEDGVIYGAVYENGEIVPAPYALGFTLDMLGLASKYLG